MLAFVGVGVPGVPEIAIILAMCFIVLLPAWKIATKAGFPGWVSLVMLIPFFNFAFVYVFAFIPWPALEAQPPAERRA